MVDRVLGDTNKGGEIYNVKGTRNYLGGGRSQLTLEAEPKSSPLGYFQQ